MLQRMIGLFRAVDPVNLLNVQGYPADVNKGVMPIADRSGIQFVRMAVDTGGGAVSATARAPGVAAGIAPGFITAMDVANFNFLWNGASWDMQTGNESATPLAAAVRAATTDSAALVNYNARGLHLAFNVTAVTAAQTVTPVLQGQDPASLTWYDLLVGPAIGAAGLTILKLYPGIMAVPNLAAADILPRAWRVEVRHSAGGNFTYSAGAQLVI